MREHQGWAKQRLAMARAKAKAQLATRKRNHPTCVWCGAPAVRWDEEGGWCELHFGTF